MKRWAKNQTGMMYPDSMGDWVAWSDVEKKLKELEIERDLLESTLYQRDKDIRDLSRGVLDLAKLLAKSA